MSKRGATLILLLISLVSLNGIACSEDGMNFKSILSIRLSGRMNYLPLADINKCLNSVNNNETFKYWRENDPSRIDGKIAQLNSWLTDWEAELMININPVIGVGIATSGAFNRRNESSLTYTDVGSAGNQITAMSYEPEIQVSMPIKLSVYYALHPRKSRNIFFTAGIGYYEGRMKEYFKYEVTTPSGGYGWSSRYWETQRKSSLGLHAGVGIELFFTRNLALVVESQGRYIKIRNFQGAALHEDSDSNYAEESGTLYYFTFWNPGIGAGYADLEVWKEPPEASIYYIANIRKAILDLSGFSFRVGIRIRLF
ncbi:MAG: outer membrane beta-barrel protein [Promethearchaeota archaeon]